MKDFLKEHYFKEIERRYAIENSCTTLISLVTVLIAAEFTLWFAVINGQYSFNCCPWILYILIIIFFSIQIWGLIQTLNSYNNLFKGFEYELIPYYEEIEDVKKDYDDDDEFESEFWKVVTSSIDANQKINDKKSEYLYSAKSILISSLIPLILVFCFLSLCSIPKQDISDIDSIERLIEEHFNNTDKDLNNNVKNKDEREVQSRKGTKSESTGGSNSGEIDKKEEKKIEYEKSQRKSDASKKQG